MVADFLSRVHFNNDLSTNSDQFTLDDDDSKMIICGISGIPLQEFIDETGRDKTLISVAKWLKNGWPQSKSAIPKEARPYFEARQSLSIEGGIILKGSAICVPTALRGRTTELLHSGHPGIVRMQQQYQNFYYWPGGSQEMKSYCEECEACRRSDSAKPQESIPIGAIPPPSEPWTELSMDITGPFASAPKSQ
ncbi:MAG: hypothetical protein GY799_09425 [Desulfobulbaceae bacterium]|nr:hypothetical protein [Desulfobulbaceae bacterium]